MRSSRVLARPARTSFRILGAAVLMLGIAGSASAAEDEGYAAYVDTTALNLRAAPGTSSAVVGILLKYDRIRVLERAVVGGATWYSVEAGGGYTNGWVHGGYIAFGEPPSGIFPEGPVDYGKPETPTLMKGPWKYQGAKVCAECHDEPTGDFHLGAYKVWSRHVHSAAYATLKRDYTKEIARRTRGIDDPLDDWRCVKCHTTAYGAPASQIAASYSPEEGVTCEVCHGPSSQYAHEDHGPSVPNREAMGFRILKDLTQRREVCTSCHNPASPTYKPFNLREYSRDIAHWVDKGDRSYYADATAEAARRQARVEAARQKQAEQALAERKQREGEEQARADAARAKAEKEAEQQRLAALSEQQRQQEEQRKAEAEKAAAAAEAKRIAEEEKRKEEEERRKAEAALAQQKAHEAEQARQADAARKKAEEEARKAAAKSKGIERYLEDVDDVIILNPNGKKYNKVKFAHLAHASNKYMPDGTCQTCHHTQEGDESPEACNSCHDIGGDADEEKAKKRYVHTKSDGFPRGPDQEQTSCVGCHKSQNELLEMGKRTGKEAPTKCTKCHSRK